MVQTSLDWILISLGSHRHYRIKLIFFLLFFLVSGAERARAATVTAAEAEAVKTAEEVSSAADSSGAVSSGIASSGAVSSEAASSDSGNPVSPEDAAGPAEAAAPAYAETPAEQAIYSYVQVPYTYYKVQRWVGCWHSLMAGGQKFFRFGCGICCLTNMYDTLLGRNLRPDRMFEKCKMHTDYSPGGGVGAISWDQVKAMCDLFNFDSELKNKPKDYAEFQQDMADAKTLMVLVCRYNDKKLWPETNGHYVNLWEYDPETDTVFVTDSSGYHNRERIALEDIYRALKTGSAYQYLAVAGVNTDDIDDMGR